MTYDNYLVTQIMDCAISLTDAAAPTDPTLTFDSVTTTANVGVWTLFFANADLVNCAITSCILKASGCSSAYVAGQLSIAPATPWTITAN